MGEIERQSLSPGNTCPGAQGPRKPHPTPTSVLARALGPSGWILRATGSALSHWPVFLRHGFFCSLSDTPHPRPSKPHGGEIVSLFVLVD